MAQEALAPGRQLAQRLGLIKYSKKVSCTMQNANDGDEVETVG